MSSIPDVFQAVRRAKLQEARSLVAARCQPSASRRQADPMPFTGTWALSNPPGTRMKHLISKEGVVVVEAQQVCLPRLAR